MRNEKWRIQDHSVVSRLAFFIFGCPFFIPTRSPFVPEGTAAGFPKESQRLCQPIAASRSNGKRSMKNEK